MTKVGTKSPIAAHLHKRDARKTVGVLRQSKRFQLRELEIDNRTE